MGFQGKTAVVTGGAGYIGSAICRRLTAQGVKVALFDRATAPDSPDIFPVAVDLTDDAAVAKATAEVEKKFGGIDFLVTCAGGSARERIRPFAEQEMKVIRDVVQINLFGALNCIRAVVPGMIARKSGNIVNISSLVAIGGVSGCADYAAAKGGIIAATRTLAMELGPHNININCVCPGKVQRPDAMPADPEAFARKHSCLNRLCTADDIAATVLFLLSDEASFITGQNYIVDGGRSLGLKGTC